MAYVYRHIRHDKNEPFYIGISKKDDLSRAYATDYRHRNKIWSDIVAKTTYDVDVLFDNIPYDFAKEKEKEFISLYKRMCDGGTLANITLGGDGVLGFKNVRLSERNKNGIWRGKKHTEESKKRISQSNKGRLFCDSHKKRISDFAKTRTGKLNPNFKGNIQILYGGNLLSEKCGMKEVAEYIGCSLTTVHKILNNDNFCEGKFKMYSLKRMKI